MGNGDVDAPSAYVCAGSRIYDATEWYICQHNFGKGTSSGQRGGHMPTPNIEETMTEEELFEWLQNAVHAGAFDNFSGTATESPSPKSGNGMKSLCDPC
ncbi:hypothetical protein JHK82_036590 [Glycine max]|nr:hypothetical protein JHK85_037324 [Glycine max]KAG5113321.1 hypothetical protein JHK82_036590 [Glycine max]